VSERGSIQDYASGLRASRGPEDRWLSIYEVAAMTLQNPETVRRWVRDGLVRSENRGRLGVRIPESEVELFVQNAIRLEGRNPADHGLSSNLIDAIQTDAPSERRAAGAGWPFHGGARDSTAS
jgi:hypothetical protein